MAFESLSEKLQGVMNKLRGKARITEDDIKEVSREVKLALLEADVNYKIVKDFTAKISEKALGQDVLKSLTPGQQVIKIVHDELVDLLGKEEVPLNISANPPTIIMMAGLQGSGKTTMAAKLANMLRKKGKSPLLVACDIYRPAAIDQLQVLGKQLNIPVFADKESKDVIDISGRALKEANSKLNDVVIVDTAGRLHIDEELMDELKRLKAFLKPHEILLVVDSMTGQDAVTVAQSFDEQLGIDSVALTKLDGDTRGGAALSVKAVTGKPIKFSGTGEKMNDIEVFHPDRMATRILGMGDVLTLIEKAEESFDMEAAEKLEKKLRKQEFTLQDYLDQLKQIKKMGSIKSILGMIGIDPQTIEQAKVDEKQFVRAEAIIQSMTIKEREDPDILNGKRRRRIADGAGTTVQEVNKFIKQYTDTKMMMKSMMSGKGPMKGLMKKVMGEASKLDADNISEEDIKKMTNMNSLKDLRKFMK
ncbi:MAG: signal recognition particle protein [Clostridia bacterium]|nr:signal recognition particle protein [Clostridia bacterium]